MVNSPFRNRNEGSRVVVKENSVSVQWWTLKTLSWLKLLIVRFLDARAGLAAKSFVHDHSYTNE